MKQSLSILIILLSLCSCSKYYSPGYKDYSSKPGSNVKNHSKPSDQFAGYPDTLMQADKSEDVRPLQPASISIFKKDEIISRPDTADGFSARQGTGATTYKVFPRLHSRKKISSERVNEETPEKKPGVQWRKVFLVAAFCLMVATIMIFPIAVIFEILGEVLFFTITGTGITGLIGLLLRGDNPEWLGVDIVELMAYILSGVVAIMSIIFIVLLIHLFRNGLDINILGP